MLGSSFIVHPSSICLILAAVDYADPLLWAVFLAWILSVVLHEFGHGLAAYLGGDYTIRERGGLTLNPFQYIDPLFSIVIPAAIFLMGGVPLPGGVTYIRRDLIRNRTWQILTSAAGPAMNFLLFLGLIIPFHPRLGWLTAPSPFQTAPVPNAYLFLGALAWLEMLSVIYNLLPIPPLDGYQIVAEFLPPATRAKIRSISTTIFFIFFMIIWRTPAIGQAFHDGVRHTLEALGYDAKTIHFFGQSFNRVLFGSKR